MSTLWGFNPQLKEWVPLDVKRLCYLLLQAQRLEAAGCEWYIQIGTCEELFS